MQMFFFFVYKYYSFRVCLRRGRGRMCKSEKGDGKFREKKRVEADYVIAYVDRGGARGKEGRYIDR